VRIQSGNRGYLATLPLVKSGTRVEDVLSRMKEFRRGAAVVARADGTFTVVTAEEISAARGARSGENARSVCVDELFSDRGSAQRVDVGVMARVMHGLWESRGGQLDYRIVAIGKNAVTVLGPSAEHWQRLTWNKERA